jgi:hypothetical protein
MKSRLFLLKLNTITHSIFIISSIFSVIFSAINIHNIYIDIAAFMVFFSFLVFRRCILVDTYNEIKQDLNQFDLPSTARDSLTRSTIKKFLNKIIKEKKTSITPMQKEKIEELRLDILKNIEPFVDETNPDAVEDMMNRKIQYIVGNIIIGTTLGKKYNINWLNIMLIIWMVFIFPF